MMKTSNGFTLLELMIAISILATLMVFSNQSIQNGFRAKMKLHDQTEDMSSVRDALRVMEKDINLAMHFRDIEMEFKQTVQKSSAGGGPQAQTYPGQPVTPTTPAPGATPQQAQANQQQINQTLQQWLQQDPDRKDPTTQFVGSSDELHFITMNAPRMSEDIPQADFIKVGYYLSDCKKPGSTGMSTKCLLRSSDPLVETDVTKNGPSTVLLDNVTEFKLRYIGASKQDWVTDWNSKTGDAGTKDNFPDSVEISLTVTKGEGEKKKKISMQVIAPIRFANNPPPPAQAGAPGSAAQPGAQQQGVTH
jgi:prepilin-type N-terminal cleavage/methylation domain-containing protein